MTRPLIVGNWKMNTLRHTAMALAQDIGSRYADTSADERGFDLMVCPPFPYLPTVGEAIAGSGVALGAQDCHAAGGGAHTGDVAAEMLADIGCAAVILGHSERRTDHGEIDLAVSEKARAAHRAGLIAIICIGETEAERDAGQAADICARQIAGSVPKGAVAEDTVIAYEPVWAIGTGRTPTAADVADMHGHIRGELSRFLDDADRVRLLYGGSVKPGNAIELLSVPNVDGALVGGASLSAEDFWAIAQSS